MGQNEKTYRFTCGNIKIFDFQNWDETGTKVGFFPIFGTEFFAFR